MAKSNEKLKEEILDWIKNENWTRRKFLSIPLNKMVEFSKAGMRHTVNRNYKKYPEIELKISKDIMKILPNSFYMSFDKNTDNKRKEVIGVHNFYDIVLFEKELYEVWFKVKETRDKLFFYDHGIIKKLK